MLFDIPSNLILSVNNRGLRLGKPLYLGFQEGLLLTTGSLNHGIHTTITGKHERPLQGWPHLR